jgi:dihydrolipoamide dehydrogenase
MAELHYDVAVIGGGPGGYTAAIRAAQLGLKAAVIERDRLGGVCLNWGCIPTKALLKNAEIVQTVFHGEEWGITAENIQLDFTRVIRRSRSVADRISKGVEFLMKKNGIEVHRGTATLRAPGTLDITADGDVTAVTARHIIIATGARPRTIPGVTLDRKRVITSTEAMTLGVKPAALVIVGAGAIGVEFSYFYNAIGTRVTLVEMLPSILPVEDRELTKQLELSFKKRGMEILTGSTVDRITPKDSSVEVSVTTPEGPKTLTADHALLAIGVQGNIENLGLEVVGVKTERGQIVVDADYRTSAPGVYAVGDVIGPPWLAHVAAAEGIHCVEAIAGKNPPPLDYTAVPGCTYCQPQVASVGMTEEKAREAGLEVRVGKVPFRPFGKAVAIGETEGLVKLIFDAKYGELLGAHILGSDATEMIAELVLAKRLEATGPDLFRTIHAHPTLSEAVMEAAAAAYGEAINV